jgi:exopolysaccharide production protein ExoY
MRAQFAAKRGLDLCVALTSLLMLAPLLVIIAVVMKVTDRGPILFAQTRVGKGGQRFKCYKFRSMVVDAEAALQDYLSKNEAARQEWELDQKLNSDPRITLIGQFLRRSSLDELPQLFNVLIGDMSIVGPRPIVPGEIYRYGERYREYISVQPGITGLWQVSGRSNCTYSERVTLDSKYVYEWSLKKDLIILIKTVPAVLSQSGSR